MDKDHYMFYAFNVNGHTAYIFDSAEEALAELSTRLKEDDTDAYEIEPIEGIWRMLERYSNFEDRYNDQWMEEVVQVVCESIFNRSDTEKKKSEKPPKETNSKK